MDHIDPCIPTTPGPRTSGFLHKAGTRGAGGTSHDNGDVLALAHFPGIQVMVPLQRFSEIAKTRVLASVARGALAIGVGFHDNLLDGGGGGHGTWHSSAC